MSEEPSIGLVILQEALAGFGYAELVKLRPPYDMVIRDINGNFYTITIHQQPSFTPTVDRIDP